MAPSQKTGPGGESAQGGQHPDTPAQGPVFKDILCAVDGTRASTAAVRMAAHLAGPEGHLTLLAVTAAQGSGPNATAAISPGRVEHVLTRAKHIADEAGVRATTIVDPGHPPVEVILVRAAAHDLLALGAPAGSWLGGMLIGGVAAAALGQFDTPMLVARRSFTGSLRGGRILVASDGQEGSDRVVETAGRLGLGLGAQVTILNAVAAESDVRPHQIQAQGRALERMLPGRSEVRVEPGRAADVIMEAAHSSDVAIAVLGSRRLGGVRALGSVSRRVAHDADCSVLLLPPQDSDAPAMTSET